MRNLLEYPITAEEVVGTLHRESQHASNSQSIGDTRAMCLELAAEFLTQHPVGSSRVDLQACKLEYSIVSPK